MSRYLVNIPVRISGDPPSAYQDRFPAKNSGTANIVAGDLVMFDTADTTGSSVRQSNAANSVNIAGVAVGTIQPGKEGEIVRRGFVRAKVAGGTTAGAILASAAAAGTLTANASANPAQFCGVAVTAESDGFSIVFIQR